jgi:hypothetical protein
MQRTLLSAILASASWTAHAAPLTGDYHLDFYASSGACREDVGVEVETTRIVTDASGGTEYLRFGWRCHDRTFGGSGGVTDPDQCSNSVETNTLSDDGLEFESVWTSRVVVDGTVERLPYSRFTMKLVNPDRLQTDLVGYEHGSSVPRPYFRCFYDRVN